MDEIVNQTSRETKLIHTHSHCILIYSQYSVRVSLHSYFYN